MIQISSSFTGLPASPVLNGALARRDVTMMRCRSQRFLRYFVFVGLFVIFAFHFKSSSKEIFASDVSVRDGRRLFGDVSDEISVDFRNLLPMDKRLLSKVKQMIEKPEKGDYNLTNPDVEDFSRGQSSIIDILLKQKVCMCWRQFFTRFNQTYNACTCTFQNLFKAYAVVMAILFYST